MPQIDVHARIDHVLRDTVEQVVRRSRLDNLALVLRAVIAERCRVIQFARQRQPAASRSEANCAQYECTASDGWSELVILPPDFSRGQKPETSDEGSFEEKDAQCEANQRDQSRPRNRQPDVACPQYRLERDREYYDRQHNQN